VGVGTGERELIEPVDLALEDGLTLNPDARGWSRRPLHRVNLRGGWGRTKRWDYWAILAGDLVVSCVFADIDYLGLADVWWADLGSGHTGGRGVTVPAARGMTVPAQFGSAPMRIARRHFRLEIRDDPDATTHLVARWREPDGRAGRLDAAIALPPGHESLNVVIPWSARRFQFTSKHQARPARGQLSVGERSWRFGDDEQVERGERAFGVLDVGRGRWPYRTRWNWGGGAGYAGAGGPLIGLQLGGLWTAGTGFTENGVLVDGRLTKLGRELRWEYDWARPLSPWRVADPDGRLRLELTPRHDKHTRLEAGVLGTETHQVFGRWSGRFVPDDGGEPILFDGLQGFAEESRSRW
jgi:hypothetical protein